MAVEEEEGHPAEAEALRFLGAVEGVLEAHRETLVPEAGAHHRPHIRSSCAYNDTLNLQCRTRNNVTSKRARCTMGN